MYPISPSPILSRASSVGVNTPTSSAMNFSPAIEKIKRSWRFTLPLKIRTYTITPRWSSYLKSNTSARRPFSDSSRGGGTRSMIALSKSGTPSPVRPETESTVLGSIFKSFPISSFTSSGRASGESILETAGTMTSPSRRADSSVVSV